jgi:hypothetical protein
VNLAYRLNYCYFVYFTEFIDFENDVKHGYGDYYWADGRIFSGPFENDQMHGQGEYTDRNGVRGTTVMEYGVIDKRYG